MQEPLCNVAHSDRLKVSVVTKENLINCSIRSTIHINVSSSRDAISSSSFLFTSHKKVGKSLKE